MAGVLSKKILKIRKGQAAQFKEKGKKLIRSFIESARSDIQQISKLFEPKGKESKDSRSHHLQGIEISYFFLGNWWSVQESSSTSPKENKQESLFLRG